MVSGKQNLQVQRSIRIEPSRTVYPLEVTMKGEGQQIELVYLRSGGSFARHTPFMASGLEGPSQALFSPPLVQLWSAVAREREDQWALGFPDPSGIVGRKPGVLESLPVVESLTLGETPRGQSAIWDPQLLLLYAPPELEVFQALSQVSGRWEPGGERSFGFALVHHEGFPALEGRTRLVYLGLVEGNAVFEIEAGVKGPIWPPRSVFKSTFTRSATGTLLVDGDGSAAGAELMIRAAIAWPQGGEAGRVEQTVRMERLPGPGKEWEKSPGAELSRLLAASQRDPLAFCSEVLKKTIETSTPLILNVRPKADLTGARGMVLDESVHLEEVRSGGTHILDSVTAAGILDAQGEVLLRLKVFDKATLDGLRDRFGKRWQELFAGHAVLGKKTFVAQPDQVATPEVIVHELAHLAAGSFDYGNHRELAAGSTQPLDAAWLDLDGVIAAWALTEGEAVLTTQFAMARPSGPEAMQHLWRQWRSGQEGATGSPDYAESLLGLVYGRSSGLLILGHLSGESLEATLARTWSGFSYQSREVLFPGDPSTSSRLWTRLRGLDDRSGLAGATRVGAFTLAHALARARGLSWPAAERIVRKLEDDLVLWTSQGAAWLSRWQGERDAKAFGDLYSTREGDVRVEIRGRDVIVLTGDLGDTWQRLRGWIAE
jgi:hypothetical protein